MKHYKRWIINNYKNLRGWRNERKIVVIESDDWGSIRMPSKEVYQKLLNIGIRVDKCPYNKYDSLANEEDLEKLFELLSLFKDKNGNPPVITANCVVANPDFDNISKNNFSKYYFEPFTETLLRYPRHTKSFSLWCEGIKSKIFIPQFHGREHLNVLRWMKNLKLGSKETKIAFDNKFFGLSTTITSEKRGSYMAAFDFDHPDEIAYHKQVIKEGLQIFEKIFGYKSESFIAPNGVWHPLLEETLYANGVKYIQGGGQKVPSMSGAKTLFKPLGSFNEFDQLFLMRNASFEPSARPFIDSVEHCLKDISRAFFYKKPAVISSHRLNFIGNIEPKNRDYNLKEFKKLIKKIVTRWPDVEFMTSDQLGRLISENKTK